MKMAVLYGSLISILMTLTASGVMGASPLNPDSSSGMMNYFGAMTIVLYIISFVIAILIAIYMYKDAEARGKSGIVWGIIGCICSLCGLVIWLLVRPPVYNSGGVTVNTYSSNISNSNMPVQAGQQPMQQYQPQQVQTQQPVQQAVPQQGGQQAPVCPTCGKPGTFVPQYNRYYCYNCQKYL